MPETVDVFNPGRYVEGIPHEDFMALRARGSVIHHVDYEQPAGFWAVTRHTEVVHVSRNPGLFSSQRKTCILNEMTPESLEQQQLMMLNLDPPEHNRMRSLVNRGFTPRMISRMQSHLTEICEKIVDNALALGSGNFVELCSADLPLIVLAELLGVPVEDRGKLFDWSNRLASANDLDPQSVDDVTIAVMEAYAYANDLGAQKRACPADDIVSRLVSPDDSGGVLSELEFDLFFILLMFAGNETTRNAISGGMQAMMDHPEQWERLRSNPDLAPSAADEIVRWVSPVNAFRRTATQDMQLGGQFIRENDKVVVFYSSANYDEAAFENPYAFDIGRDPNPHVGFGGGGPHFCLGRHLAMLEVEIMFRTLAQKVRLVERTGPLSRLRSNFVNGITDMPVRLIPA